MVVFIVRGMYLILSNFVDFIFGNVASFETVKISDGFVHRNVQSDEPPFLLDRLFYYGGQAVLFFVIWKLYKIFFSPVNRVKDLSDVGWEGSKQGVASRIREIQRMRKSNDLPPVYPNGWFAIAESRSIPNKQVISVHCLGETFAVFRGDDGKVSILDAFCPHMGANMAVGGIVKGNCLECPFHGWLFDGRSGACSHIPYAKKVPDFAKVRKWPCEEINGFIFVWYDAEGRPPQWKVPRLDAIESGEYTYRGRTEHKILAHIQEIPENGSDLAHLGHLHSPNILKGTDLNFALTANKLLDFVYHEWDGCWKPLEAPNEHCAQMNLTHSFPIFGFKLKMFDVKVRAEQIGPGLVHLHFDTYFGKGILVQTVTPEEPLQQKFVHNFYSSSTYVAPLAKLTILGEAFQVERDIMIWNNKIFPSKPMFVAEDKLIPRFRRWYSQFYSKNSPKFEGFRKDGFDW